MKIDAHQRFWRYNDQEYPWIGREMASLQRDYLPPDLDPLQQAVGIGGTVAVQARQTMDETRWLLQLAEEYAFVRGVVGWVDLCDPDLDIVLERLARFPQFCGVRHVAQDKPDGRFLLGDEFLRGIGRLSEFDLTYDILISSQHLPMACDLADQFPFQRFVLDHMAKPPIRTGELVPWAEGIRRLAEYPNVYCKASGLVTEADWQAWTVDDLRPYLDVAFEAFGSQRILLGSDWPVCTLAGSYAQVMQLAYDYVTQFPIPEQADLCGGNAWRVYRLGR